MKNLNIISERVRRLSPSPTLAITSKANAMRKAGIDVIGFGAGEPDFDTPLFIKESAKKAIDDGFTKYTPSSGIKELKEAISIKLKKENNLNYLSEEIVVSCGAKHSIFNAIFTLVDKGDEVIIPSPYWVSYPEMVTLAGGKVVYLKTYCDENFKINITKLKKLINKRTKLLILNYPSNPTGATYNEKELKEIAEVLVENNIYCISDEIYEKILYDGNKHTSIACLGDDIKKITITVNGLSKSYSMTGWRIGYCAGPKDIMDAISNLQDHTTSNPTSFCQKAAITALTGDSKDLDIMIEEFSKRRKFIVEKLNSFEGFICPKPDGAFYVFPDIGKIIGKKYNNREITTSYTFSEILLEEAKVAVVPGAPFGSDRNIRLSFATSFNNIEKGMERIQKFIEKIF